MSPTVTDGLGADDFDGSPEGRPVPPPHERAWVHPAELGAMTAAERARVSDGVRRAGALVALTSVALVLVFVQAMNSSRRPAPRVRAFVTQPVSATTGIARPPHRMVGAAGAARVPAVAIGDGTTIVAPAGIGLPGSTVPVTFGDATYTATVLDAEVDAGLQLLQLGTNEGPLVGDATTRAPVAGTAPEPGFGESMTVHGADDAVGTATVGIASGTLHPLVPVNPDPDHPAGGGPAFDDDGLLLGWVVERNGSHLLIPVAQLLDVLPRLVANAQRP